MKTLYIECGMGAAGDMLTGALLELIPDRDGFLRELNSLGLEGVTVTAEDAFRCGIKGTHVRVTVDGEEESGDMHMHHHHEHEHTHEHCHEHTHDEDHTHGPCHGHEHTHDEEHTHDRGHVHSLDDEHEHGHHHHHTGMHDIVRIVSHLPLSKKVRTDILDVYSLIAEAESHAHGVPVTDIHFHEVGTMDAVADITAVSMLMDRIAPDRVIVSPIKVGRGHVHCAHGILPVPAPATAYILQGVPIYSGDIESELCTPTGAALLRHFATEFSSMPVMKTEAIGCGMGRKDFPEANAVRAFLGETQGKRDTVTEFTCSIDDMTAEEIAFAEEQVMKAGALDVCAVPAQMKKSRPGTVLAVLARNEDEEHMAETIFRYTTTLGIRIGRTERLVLERKEDTVETPYGPVRIKTSSGYGTRRRKAEYDDAARIAEEGGIGMREARKLIEDSI